MKVVYDILCMFAVVSVAGTLIGCESDSTIQINASGPRVSPDGDSDATAVPDGLHPVGPDGPVSSAWPILRSSEVVHGFPDNVVQVNPSCEPLAVQTISPAWFRETSDALVYGRLAAVHIPDTDPNTGHQCEGDRSGLLLQVLIEGAEGPYAPAIGETADIYVSSLTLGDWAVQPLYLKSDQSSHWSVWLTDPGEPQAVPLVGEKVMIRALAFQASAFPERTFLQGVWFFSVNPDGELVSQRDGRYPCTTQIELDGELPVFEASDGRRAAEHYGNADEMWRRISSDDLTESERVALERSSDGGYTASTAATYLTCRRER